MSISLTGMSRKELEKLQSKIVKQLVKLEAQEKHKALAAARKAVSAMGYSLEDVLVSAEPAKRKKGAASEAKKPGKPKYAHPENPALTWTGKGRQPQWFKEAIEGGKAPEELLIS